MAKQKKGLEALGGLVYSSESGKMCPNCSKPTENCICKQQQSYTGDGIVKVRRETKGRKGKGVTTIAGIPLIGDELKDYAKKLKQKCGSGGTLKDGIVEIQGEHIQKIMEELKKENWTVKKIGGKMKVLIPIAPQVEEMEVVILKDVLVRAGLEVLLLSVTTNLQTPCTRGVILVADGLLENHSTQSWDLIVLPGGMPGAKTLRDSSLLQEIVTKHSLQKKLYGAICASPKVVLDAWKLLPNSYTCHPNFKASGFQNQAFVLSQNCLTSQGPGSAFAMALAIIEILLGKEKADEIRQPLCLF